MMFGASAQKTTFLKFCSLPTWCSDLAGMKNESERELIAMEYNTNNILIKEINLFYQLGIFCSLFPIEMFKID